MNPRKLYLALASACLMGVGAIFPLREIIPEGGALSISILLALIAVPVLYISASRLASRAVRAFVGLTLVFGAIWFGVEHNVFAVAVLWAGVLFGALDSLGKVSSLVKPAERRSSQELPSPSSK